jgi:hypothetical protein
MMTDTLRAALDTDRVFFERRPDRTVRIRRAFPGEVAHLRQPFGDTPPVLDNGQAQFVIVQSMPGLGIRARFPIRGPADWDADLFTEEQCRCILDMRNEAYGDPLDPSR